MKELIAMMWRGIVTLWEDCLLFFHLILYTVVIIFLIIGVMAAFTGAPGLGIFLIVLNALFLLLMRKLDKAANENFDKELQEMVRKNLEDQNTTDTEKKK